MFPKELRSEREQLLRAVGIPLSALVWLLVLAGLVFAKWGGLVGVAYALLITAFILMAHALFLAHVRGNGVRLGPTQLPHLWNKVIAGSQRLGLQEPPTAYLIQSGGILNAFATKVLFRRFIILYSDLVDSCEAGVATDRPSEIDFVIAHELAHLAAGHLGWTRWFLIPMRLVPLLGPAYSRACEYTCDRAGHAFVANLETSSRALCILAAGRRAGRMLDLDAFVEQRRETGGFWMAVYELNSTHPYLPKRVAALREYATPGTAPGVGRNIAAYPLAPMFGAAIAGPSGGGAVFVVIIAVAAMSAGAAEGLKKYTEMARAKQQLAAFQPTAEPEPTAGATTAAAPARADEPGVVRGERFDWSLRMPNARWEVLPTAQARKQNQLADRWLTRADLDAHLLIIGEHMSGTILSIDQLAATVLTNAKKSAAKFKVVGQKQVGSGRVYEVRSTVGGLPLTQFFGIFISGENAYQVYGFAPETSHAKVKDDLLRAIASFQPAS